MAENQVSQSEATERKESSEGNGGTHRQGRNVVTQESAGREGPAVTRTGSRQPASATQNPFAMMRQLSREMDRFMDSFFDRGFGGSLLRETSTRGDEWQGGTLWTPQIDVQHRGDAIIVRADLPGVSKEDVQVDIQDDALIISGQRREEREEGADDQGYRMVERSYGSFYRSVPLPQGTNPDGIQAVMRDGVLKVTLPIADSARPRRIEIQS